MSTAPGPVSRLDVVLAGHRASGRAASGPNADGPDPSDLALVSRAHTAEDPAVRAAALTAAQRQGVLGDDRIADALADPARVVVRAASALAARRRPSVTAASTSADRIDSELLARLGDDDPVLVEVAAWALGERFGADDDGTAPLSRSAAEVIGTLMIVVTSHDDALCRESAVAALGSIGAETGLPAILSALNDRATVRRRAVLALAPFDGPAVDAALERASTDRDWQVRQAAEDLRS